MSSTSRVLWVLAALLFGAVAVVAWIKVDPMLDLEATFVAIPSGDCDLHEGPCEAVFSNGSRVAFEVTPRPIPPVKRLTLSVRTEGIDARQAEVDFSGMDMDMGFNRVALDRSGSGEYRGSGMLPICVRARMSWEAKVLLRTESGLMAAPFRFDTYRPGKEPSSLPRASNAE